MAHSVAIKSVVGSLCETGKLLDALKITLNNFQSDYKLYSKPLQVCINNRAKKEGRLIHKHLETTGLTSSLCLNTKLVIFYSKIGDMITAHNVFQKMSEPNVVTWTALLSGYSQNGQPKEALNIFSAMNRDGLKPNQFTYGSALRACTTMMCLNRGKQIHACIQKGRFVNNLFVQSALVDLHAKCGSMEDASLVFASTSKNDVVLWNTMISGYSVQGFGDDSFLFIRSMLREGILPDCFTFGSVLRASVGNINLIYIVQVHGFVIHLGFESHKVVVGSLVDAYAKCGSTTSAKYLCRSMLKIDMVSCTALITGYARDSNKLGDALELFIQVHRTHIIDNILLCSMINVCANIASLDLGRQLHALVVKCQPSGDVVMGNALIDMYSKSGEIEDAEHVFNGMWKKNIVTWTSLIAGYGKHGCGPDAIALYKRMEIEGLKPNDVTFLSLLFACSHNGLIDEGWECFKSMVGEYKIFPRVEHYACMVDLFSRGGQLEEAYYLVSNMNSEPNASLWGALLKGCSIYGNMLLGEVAAKNLFDIEPHKSVNYVVLAGIYAATGLWNHACKIWDLLDTRSLKKTPGSSFIPLTKKGVALLTI